MTENCTLQVHEKIEVREKIYQNFDVQEINFSIFQPTFQPDIRIPTDQQD